MSTVKIEKRTSVRFGDYEIKCADIVRTAQKDGAGTAYAVGLVCGEVKDGKKVRFSLVPLSHIIEGRSNIEQAVFNAYTGKYSSPEKCADIVRKFAERFNVSVGNVTQATKSPEKDSEKRAKKSAFEKICEIVEKVPENERKALLLKLAEMYEITLEK